MRIVEFDKGLNFFRWAVQEWNNCSGGVSRQQVQAENSQPVESAGSKKLARDFDGFKEHDKRVGAMLL